MVLTREKCVKFYRSSDFISWAKTGEFRLPDYALHGMIECPCMFCTDGKYVLMLSMDVPESEYEKFPEEAVPHARVMQYFTGSFDGMCFAADPSQKEVLLVDYGPDFYAGTIFSNVKETILIAWLGDFSDGARNTPTENEGFRGIQCFPRKLTIVQTENGERLHHEFFPFRKEDLPDGVILNSSSEEIQLIDNCVAESISNSGIISRSSYIAKQIRK